MKRKDREKVISILEQSLTITEARRELIKAMKEDHHPARKKKKIDTYSGGDNDYKPFDILLALRAIKEERTENNYAGDGIPPRVRSFLPEDEKLEDCLLKLF